MTPKLLDVSLDDDEVILKYDDLRGLRYALLYKAGRKLKEEYSIKKLLSKNLVVPNSNSIRISKSDYRKSFYSVSFIDFYGAETKPTVINLKNNPKNDSKR